MANESTKGNIYEQGLDKNPANHQPLTPLSFLDWAARVFPNKTAVIHGPHTCTWAEFDVRCRRMASALQKRGIGVGDTVSVMSPNAPAMLEAPLRCPDVGWGSERAQLPPRCRNHCVHFRVMLKPKC